MTSVEYSMYIKIRNEYQSKLTSDQRKLLVWMIENNLIAQHSTLERKLREYRAKKALKTMNE